jgi:hypothetical protein
METTWSIAEDPRELLEHHRELAGRYSFYSERLRNPVNRYTGRPVKESTLAGYGIQKRHFLLAIEASRREIRAAIRAGLFRRLSSAERRFVEAYKGRTWEALETAGFQGSFREKREVALALQGDPRIRAAIWKRRQERIPGLAVIEGSAA